MQQLNLSETADYLEAATIHETHEAGHAIIHIGVSGAGLRFVLINDCWGQTILNEE